MNRLVVAERDYKADVSFVIGVTWKAILASERFH
jgi:hypothetical protein